MLSLTKHIQDPSLPAMEGSRVQLAGRHGVMQCFAETLVGSQYHRAPLLPCHTGIVTLFHFWNQCTATILSISPLDPSAATQPASSLKSEEDPCWDLAATILGTNTTSRIGCMSAPSFLFCRGRHIILNL